MPMEKYKTIQGISLHLRGHLTYLHQQHTAVEAFSSFRNQSGLCCTGSTHPILNGSWLFMGLPSLFVGVSHAGAVGHPHLPVFCARTLNPYRAFRPPSLPTEPISSSCSSNNSTSERKERRKLKHRKTPAGNFEKPVFMVLSRHPIRDAHHNESVCNLPTYTYHQQ